MSELKSTSLTATLNAATLNASLNSTIRLNDYIITLEEIEGGHRLTARKGDQAQSMDIMDGTPGKPGISPIITVTDITGGHRVTINDAEGEKSFDVMDGKDGQGGGGLPEGGAAHQMLVTDAKGKTIWDNRTHWIDYEFDPIEWHGDTEGREIIDASAIGMGIWYKISDQVIPSEVLKNATLVQVEPDGNTVELIAENVEMVIDNILYYAQYYYFTAMVAAVLVLSEPIEMNGIVADSPGTYILCDLGTFDYASSIKLTSKEIVIPLDEKFLPTAAVKQYDLERYVSVESLDTLLTQYIDDGEYEGKTIQEANFPNVTTIGRSAFNNCKKLSTINFPNAISIGANAFTSCWMLKNIEFRRATSVEYQCFSNCLNLQKADFYKLSSIGYEAFHNAQALDTLIIRNTKEVCSLEDIGAFENAHIANGTGYIYVPASMVDAYKADEKWSVYANQIRAIEDYPEITGG